MKPKIAIAIASHDTLPALFAYDLASLAAYTTAALPDEVEMGIVMVTGTYIHSARAELMETMIEDGATHMLWLDADMRFPRDTLVHLLQHNLPMVGANYSKRAFGEGFTALKKVGVTGEQLRTTDESEGLEEVEGIGFGCVLIQAKALLGLPHPEEVPWFQNRYLGEGLWMGEDIHFCELVRKAGGRIFVDHDLSKAVAHIGQMEYGVATA
jgi:hypothetical protein